MPGATVTITLQALTDEANAKIQAFFKGLGANAAQMESVGKSTAHTSEGLKQLRETSMLAKEGMHGLESVVLLLGGEHFPMLAKGVVAARMGMMTLRSSAQLTGLSLGTLAPAVSIVGAAVAGVAMIWQHYAGEAERATKEQEKLMTALGRLPGILGEINTLLKAGRLSPAAAVEYSEYLTGKKKLYKGSDGQLTPNPTESPEPRGQFRPTMITGGFSPAAGVYEAPKPQSLPEASMGEAQDWVRKQLEGKGGLGDTAIEEINKLKELERQAQVDRLQGLDQEIAAIHLRYAKEREEIEAKIRFAGAAMTKGEQAAAQELLRLKKQEEASAIVAARFKDDKEKEKQATESFDRRQVELAAIAKEEDQKLERELTAKALQEGKNREDNFEYEYQQRMRLLQSQLYEGVITEHEYTVRVEEEGLKRLQGRRKEAEDAIKLQDAQAAIALAQVEGRRQLIQANPDLTELEKKKELLGALQQEYEERRRIIQVTLGRVQDLNLTPEARQMAEKGLQDLYQKQAMNELERRNLAQAGTFKGEFHRTLTELKTELGNWATQMAASFKEVFNGAISSISQGITGLIMGTMTWGQALRQVANTILTTVVQAIVQMGVRWLLTHMMMAVAGKAMAAASTAAIVPIAMGQAAIWATPAALATMASYGGAAAAAPAQIAMSLAATMAESIAAFASGGRPRVGELAIVGERGAEFFVPDVPGTILPADQTSAIRAMAASGGGVGGGFSSGRDKAIRVLIHDNRQTLEDLANNPEFENVIVSMIQKNRYRFGF